MPRPPKAYRERLEHHPRPTIGWRVVVRRYPCDVCGAQPGEDCTTFTGARAYTPHAPRSQLAHDNHWKDPEDVAEPWDGHL